MEENATYTVYLNNSLPTSTKIYVETYSVFVNFGCLILIALPGILLNVAVLVSTRCKKGIRNLQYGLHYTLFVINILLCLIWMPIKATQLYFNHLETPMPVYVCYISVSLFNMGIASIVFLVVVLGVLHLHHLSSSPIPAIRSLVKKGIIASLLTAILLTGLIIAEHPFNVSYQVCVQGIALTPHIFRFWYSLISVLLSIAYITMLLVMMVLLWLAIQAIRQHIHEMLDQARNCHIHVDSIMENQEDTYEVSREEPSKHSSVTFKEPDLAETIPNKNGISKLSNSVPHKGIKFQEDVQNSDIEEEDEEDDFDLKMRLKLQQKSSSGRRHTVANIGLGDSLLGSKRRGSLDVQRSPTTPQNYNYIRKWSVDITALQNQLENPKLHTGSYPFRELGILPEKDNCPQDEEEDESKSDVNSVSNAQTAPEMSTSETSDERKISDNREHSSITEVPSIVIDDGQEDSVWVTSQDGQTGDDEENNHIDEEILHRFHKQLKKSKQLILFYLLTLVSLLPCLMTLILQGTLRAHLGVNLVYTTSPLCIMTSITQPLILLWMDTRLNQAIKRLWNKMTHWKCVCYCNIGAGKNFFGKPLDMEDKCCDS